MFWLPLFQFRKKQEQLYGFLIIIFIAVLPLTKHYMKEMKFIGGRGYVAGQNEIHYPTLILYFLCHDP